MSLYFTGILIDNPMIVVIILSMLSIIEIGISIYLFNTLKEVEQPEDPF